MSMTLKVKRGLEASLATAGVTAGEPKYTTDKEHLYIGNGSQNVLLNDAFKIVTTLPTTNIKTDKFYYLTAVDGTHQIGMYWYDGTNWHMIGDAAEYAITKEATPETGMLATYKLKKDGVQVGEAINLPKDWLMKAATTSTVTAADIAAGGKFADRTKYADFLEGDKYIDWTINVKAGTAETDEHIYLLVKDLVTPYTAGDGITISAANVVSASVDNSSIDFTASDKKLEIKDGGVNFAKLAPADVRKSTDGIRATASAEDNKIATEKAIAQLADGYIKIEQGVANAGKMFVINASGNAELTDTIDGGSF